MRITPVHNFRLIDAMLVGILTTFDLLIAERFLRMSADILQLRDGLRELRYGKWEGLTNEFVKENYSEDYLRWLTEPAWNPPTGGETAVQLASRASLVVAEIQEQYSSGNVLLVSHKATIRVILCNLLGIDLGRYRDRIDVPAASLSLVQFGALGPMLKVLGDRSFMDADLRSLSGT